MEDDDKVTQPAEWRIPDTEITIARVAEGPRAGEFLFSPDTVEQAWSFYEAVRELPYLRPMPSDDLVLTDQLLTGWMIPMVWVEALPGWANSPVFGQVVWKWFAVLLLLGLALGAVIALFRWARRRDWDGSLGAYVRRLSVPLGALILAAFLRYFFQNHVNLTGAAAGVPDYLIEVTYGVAVVWLIWLTASWIAEAIIASPRISAESLDANLLRLAARAVGTVATLVLAFEVAHRVGIPVYGLVAGAGVGGLAVALAAKSTLENFMGALNLFADHPVRVGDICRYDEAAESGWHPVGRVESIGLRSTKIRRLDRGLITIPNSEFAQRNIVNLSACDRFLLRTTLALRYETTRDQLRFVLAELRELLHAHPKTIHTADDPVRVRFVGYGDYALNIAVRVYVRTTGYNEFLAIQEDILLRMMKLVGQAGTGFAFPSRTLYLGRDGGLDNERQQGAEKQIDPRVDDQQTFGSGRHQTLPMGSSSGHCQPPSIHRKGQVANGIPRNPGEKHRSRASGRSIRPCLQQTQVARLGLQAALQQALDVGFGEELAHRIQPCFLLRATHQQPELAEEALVAEIEAVHRATGLRDQRHALAPQGLVVGLGRAARGQSGVRTRQPLARLLVRAPDERARAALEANQEQLLEELNVKAIEFIARDASHVTYRIKVNTPSLGRKGLGPKIPEIRKWLEAEADGADIARAVAQG